MGRRLFQRLEQRIEGGRGQHVHFVDDIDFVPCTAGAHVGVGPQLANFVNASIAGTVNFQHIDVFARVNRSTNITVIIGLSRRAVGSVEGFGENPGRRRLADPPSTGEQIRMPDPIGVNGVDQRPGHLLLSHQFAKIAGAIAAGHHHVRLTGRGWVFRVLRGVGGRVGGRGVIWHGRRTPIADEKAWCDRRECVATTALKRPSHKSTPLRAAPVTA